MAKKFGELVKRMPAKAQAEVKARMRKMLNDLDLAERQKKRRRVRSKPSLQHAK